LYPEWLLMENFVVWTTNVLKKPFLITSRTTIHDDNADCSSTATV